MEENIYTLTLSDGTVLENIRCNGNNFISAVPLSEGDFSNRLARVTIRCGDYEETLENAALVRLFECEGAWWFILRERSEQELRQLRMSADLDYLAMMTGVEL